MTHMLGHAHSIRLRFYYLTRLNALGLSFLLKQEQAEKSISCFQSVIIRKTSSKHHF